MNADQQIATRHFGAAVVKALTKRGVEITGIQALPDMASPMPMANAETGYVVNDNGTGRVLRYADVLRAAA